MCFKNKVQISLSLVIYYRKHKCILVFISSAVFFSFVKLLPLFLLFTLALRITVIK